LTTGQIPCRLHPPINDSHRPWNISWGPATLRTAAAIIDTFRPVFQAAMKAILDKHSLVPAEGFERNPDGTIALARRTGDRMTLVFGHAERDYKQWLENGRPEVEYIGKLREPD
jgi:hypothetical protein